MANRKGGDRRRARSKITKHFKSRGKFSIKNYLKTFNVGDSVQLMINPDVQKGAFPTRFHGKHGVVTQKEGNVCYVEIKDVKRKKTFIVHPTHLKKMQVQKNDSTKI